MYLTAFSTLLQKLTCNAENCQGSIMDAGVVGPAPRPKEDVLRLAKEFINEYYHSIKR